MRKRALGLCMVWPQLLKHPGSSSSLQTQQASPSDLVPGHCFPEKSCSAEEPERADEVGPLLQHGYTLVQLVCV